MHSKLISLLCGFFLLFSSAVFAADINLKFGIYGSDRKSVIQRKFKPVLEDIENRLSRSMNAPVKIDMLYFQTYESGIEAIANGHVDFARLGPVSYVFAKQQNPKLSILAIESNKGSKSFQGVICTKKSSPVRTLDDLRGRTFAFGNKRSTSGRYMSQKFLYEQGIKASDLSAHTYHMKHGDVAFAVVKGYQDAGAFKGGVLKNELINNSLRILAEFTVVTHPWVVHEGLSVEIRKKLKATLLEMNNKQVFSGLKRDGFLEGSDSEYDDIREAMMKNYLFYE